MTLFRSFFGRASALGASLLLLVCQTSALAAAPQPSPLVWLQDQNRVDADITAWPISQLLQKIAGATGWAIYLEPNTEYTVSTRFKNRTPGEALPLLLGSLNYALLPQTNGTAKLLVFRTRMDNATSRIQPKTPPHIDTSKPIPDELVVRLKPGEDIEALARQLGAKVVGKNEALNTYRLQFPDTAATDKARELLSRNDGVEGIDNNYNVVHAPGPETVNPAFAPPLNLTPKATGNADYRIIGLIDTAVQAPGGNLDGFLLPSMSVVPDYTPPENEPTHGTSMLETMLNGLAAVTSESSIRVLPVDVYGDREMTTTYDVAMGVYRAVNAGATIINLSLGSEGDSPFLEQVIKSASDQGVIFFAAAGNDPGTTPTFPAAYPEVTAVTAGDRSGRVAYYANSGDFVDLVAPGTTLINYRGMPYYVLGTSASSAYTTGLAAGLGENPGASLSDVVNEVKTILPAKQNAP